VLHRPGPGDARRRVFVTGVFDIQNFGDLLFPLIAAHRLARHGFDVVPVAPSSTPSRLGDAMDPVDIASMLSDRTAVDAILVGGGYMINVHPTDFLEEYAGDGISGWAMAGLWLGATLAAALRDVPVLWNAPGVPHPFGRRIRPIVEAAVAAAGYLSVRDRGGAELLGAPDGVRVKIVPDTIADLAGMWPRESLSDAFGEFLRRKQADPECRFLALHLRKRSIAGSTMGDLAARIDAFTAEHGLTALLVAVGRSHDDPGVARELSRHLRRPHILLDDPLGLREMCAAFANSALYIGASLHGYIASCAYGVPGMLVARPAYRKFKGFLEHTGRLDDLAGTWDDALAVGAARAREPRSARITPAALAALDEHWTTIRACIDQPEAKRAERHAFVAAIVRAGIAEGGALWAMQPILDRVPPYRMGSAEIARNAAGRTDDHER